MGGQRHAPATLLPVHIVEPLVGPVITAAEE